jgi:hypothetical protein
MLLASTASSIPAEGFPKIHRRAILKLEEQTGCALGRTYQHKKKTNRSVEKHNQLTYRQHPAARPHSRHEHMAALVTQAWQVGCKHGRFGNQCK